MFLNWIGRIGLLQPEGDTNILWQFSYPVKRTVVWEIVNFLLDPTTSPLIISTPTHVKWVMEVIGQGFTLAVEDIQIMEKCVQLYGQWLLNPPEMRPPGLNQQDQFFFQRMFLQLSYLFEPRAKEDAPAAMAAPQAQARLCKEVLENMFLVAAHRLAHVLTQETWEVWLKLLMGVVDSIFRNKSNSGPMAHAFLVKSLGPPAVRVLMEVWMLSKTENVELWKSLQELIPYWVIVPTIWHWNSACLGLTQRTMAVMYGPVYGLDVVTIDWSVDEKSTVRSQLNLPAQSTFYFWQRFLHLLPNPNSYMDPEIYRVAFLGVSRLIDLYLAASEMMKKDQTIKRKKKTPPTGNTLLAIFGRWLFEAVMADRPGYEDGTSIALATLCKIFTKAIEPAFLSIHLASFFNCLAKVLQKDITDKVLSTLLLNCRTLFVRELPGCHTVLPYFFHAFSRVWHPNGPDPNIRSACIDIISTLISLGDHFTDVPIISKFDGQISYSDTPDVMNLSMSTTSDLKPHLQHLMSRAISIEESARNIQRLLWCTVALLLQMERRDGMPSTEGDIRFATFVIQEIIRLSKRKWSADVNLVAYAALSSLTYGYKHLDASRLETARSVVVALAETIMENVNKTVNEWEREDNDRLLQRSFITMTDWFMVDPEFTASIDQASYAVLLKSIVTALGGVVATGVRPATPAPSIRAAASFALNILLYRSANFPTLSGPHRVSSEISEEDVLAQINPDPEIAKQHMRYFALDGSIILTLIDVPNPGGKPYVVVFVRDAVGRHKWTSKLRLYDESDLAAINPPSDPQLNSAPSITQPANPDLFDSNVVEPLYTDLVDYLPAVWQGRYYQDCLTSNAEAYVDNEKQFLAKKSWGLNKDIKFRLPLMKDPYSGECKFIMGRMLLSHLGLLLPENQGRLQPLEHGKKGFDDAVASLDSIWERETIGVGVVLVDSTPKRRFDYLLNTAGPTDYDEFLQSVGWSINLWEHTGFRGGLTDRKCGDYAPYYANYSTEIICEVASWMPNDVFDSPEKVIAWKRRVLAKNNVVVVWNLNEEYDPHAVTLLQKDIVQIVITPLPSGLYHMRVYKDNKALVLGPILDSMVLSKRLLGEMVRRTTILAHRMVTMDRNPVAPLLIRKAKIEELIAGFGKSMAYDDFLTYLFVKKQQYIPSRSEEILSGIQQSPATLSIPPGIIPPIGMGTANILDQPLSPLVSPRMSMSYSPNMISIGHDPKAAAAQGGARPVMFSVGSGPVAGGAGQPQSSAPSQNPVNARPVSPTPTPLPGAYQPPPSGGLSPQAAPLPAASPVPIRVTGPPSTQPQPAPALQRSGVMAPLASPSPNPSPPPPSSSPAPLQVGGVRLPPGAQPLPGQGLPEVPPLSNSQPPRPIPSSLPPTPAGGPSQNATTPAPQGMPPRPQPAGGAPPSQTLPPQQPSGAPPGQRPMPPPGTLPPTPNPGGPPSTPGGGPPTGPRPSPPGAKGMAGMAPPPTNQPAQQQQPGLLPPSAHAALTQSGPAKIPVGAVKMPGAGSPGPIQRSLSTSDGPQPGMPPNNNTPSSRKPSTFAASPFAKFMPGPPKQPQPQPPGK